MPRKHPELVISADNVIECSGIRMWMGALTEADLERLQAATAADQRRTDRYRAKSQRIVINSPNPELTAWLRSLTPTKDNFPLQDVVVERFLDGKGHVVSTIVSLKALWNERRLDDETRYHIIYEAVDPSTNYWAVVETTDGAGHTVEQSKGWPNHKDGKNQQNSTCLHTNEEVPILRPQKDQLDGQCSLAISIWRVTDDWEEKWHPFEGEHELDFDFLDEREGPPYLKFEISFWKDDSDITSLHAQLDSLKKELQNISREKDRLEESRDASLVREAELRYQLVAANHEIAVLRKEHKQLVQENGLPHT